jgi:hypothetical protein
MEDCLSENRFATLHFCSSHFSQLDGSYSVAVYRIEQQEFKTKTKQKRTFNAPTITSYLWVKILSLHVCHKVHQKSVLPVISSHRITVRPRITTLCNTAHITSTVCDTAQIISTVCDTAHIISRVCDTAHIISTVCGSAHSISTVCDTAHIIISTVCDSAHSINTVCDTAHIISTVCDVAHSIIQYVILHTSSAWSVTVHTALVQYVILHTSSARFVTVHTASVQYVILHILVPSIQSAIQHTPSLHNLQQ